MLGDSPEDIVDRAITDVLTKEFGVEPADCVDPTNLRADLSLKDVEVYEVIAAIELKLDVELASLDDGNDVSTVGDLANLFVPLVRRAQRVDLDGLVKDLQASDRK